MSFHWALLVTFSKPGGNVVVAVGATVLVGEEVFVADAVAVKVTVGLLVGGSVAEMGLVPMISGVGESVFVAVTGTVADV